MCRFHHGVSELCSVPATVCRIIYTFLVSRRPRERYSGHARLCVCVSVRGRMPTPLHADPDVTWGNGKGCPLVVHYCVKCQRVLCTRSMPGYIPCPIKRLPDIFSCNLSKHYPVLGRPFIKRFALWYGTVVCLSVLSVTLVYCGQTVGWIKMKLDTEVGLGPGQIVLGEDPARSPSPKGHSVPNFRPMFVVGKWLNGSRCHLV